MREVIFGFMMFFMGICVGLDVEIYFLPIMEKIEN